MALLQILIFSPEDLFIYLVQVGGGGEREISSRLHADLGFLHGTRSHNPEMMTWAELNPLSELPRRFRYWVLISEASSSAHDLFSSCSLFKRLFPRSFWLIDFSVVPWQGWDAFDHSRLYLLGCVYCIDSISCCLSSRPRLKRKGTS